MSNPTTPFGWQMPTATDLVTDLPADFEVFGQAVATSMADLLGGTTGQVLSKTSNTDMDFTWTSPNPGDITGVTAGVGISGGGTSGDVTVTNSMATAMTTSGDLIQATGSGTFARLATGTNGQYLTTNGTTNSWVTPTGAGWTQAASGSLSGASLSITGLSGSRLFLELDAVSTTTNEYMYIRLNNDSGTNYLRNPNTGLVGDANYVLINTNMAAASTYYGYATFIELANTSSTYKPIYGRNDSAYQADNWASYRSTSAITQINIILPSGAWDSGTYKVWKQG